jgi:hypothetical protein
MLLGVHLRKKTVLSILVILAIGLLGTGLSTLHMQNEYIGDLSVGTFKESYGFPLGWYGYSQTETAITNVLHLPPEVYWFSLGSLLLDAAFWFAISFLVCFAAMKSVSILHKRRASKKLSTINV